MTELNGRNIVDIIAELSLEEKAELCSGVGFWETKAYPEKGIPAIFLADGPHGVRREDKENVEQNGGLSIPATCFPPAVTMASSWDVELMKEVAQAMGIEAAAQDVDVLLGPGANIKRSPLCGRNFEYFSEDPLLSGQLAAAWIEGVQSKGVSASLKHFAVNSQETRRMSVSAAVDERALFELYLKPFEIAVKSAKPHTVMASYNKINGVYSCNNRRLLAEILRLRFGFDGLVMSDWGAEDKRDAGIAAGLDLEMPSSYGNGAYIILKAIRENRLTEDALDTACLNILRLVARHVGKSKSAPCDYDAHDELAAMALAKSAVLLKNEDALLPFSATERLCVIGEMAEKPHFQGAGSSVVNAKKRTNFLQALQNAGQSFEYIPGYRGYETSPEMIQQAVEAAKKGGQVAVFVGLPPYYDCESYDREHLRLPDFQLQLLAAVSAVNKNICVVLCCGSAVETPWLEGARALLCPYVGGQAVGEGVRRLLFGLCNPAGKLAESWPLQLSDTPCYHHYPMGPKEVTYNESLYVGYRYYDTADVSVQFPFGFGLSYTRFEYGEMRLSADTLSNGEDLQVYFTVQNTGDVAGDEVCQVYLFRKSSAMWQPAHELCGFARVSLQAGEKKTVHITISARSFLCYEPNSGGLALESGRCEIQVGGCSRNLPLVMPVELQGVTLSCAPQYAKDSPYGAIADNSFSQEMFAPLYGKNFIGNTLRKKGEYTMDTALGEMYESRLVRFAIKRSLAIARKQMNFSDDPLANEKLLRSNMENLPFKNVVSFSQGAIDHDTAEVLLRTCNGRGGLFKALWLLLKNWRRMRKIIK